MQQRAISRIDLFADNDMEFDQFRINGISAYTSETQTKPFSNRRSNRLFTYYVVDNEPLDIEMVVSPDQKTKFVIYESSNDLLTHPLLSVPQRSSDMITKPFILNDAVIVKKTIDIN
jgi:hypothetical protein